MRRIGQGGPLLRREHARRGERRTRLFVEERVRPAEPHSHQPRSFGRRSATRPNERGGGAFAGSGAVAECSKIRQSGAPSTSSRLWPVGPMVHERMNEPDHREARAGSVGERGAATLRVPAEDPAGEVQAAHRIGAG